MWMAWGLGLESVFEGSGIWIRRMMPQLSKSPMDVVQVAYDSLPLSRPDVSDVCE